MNPVVLPAEFEIARMVHPDGEGQRVLAIIVYLYKFKFDESYKNHRSLVLGGWIAEESQWKQVANSWKDAIAFENETLPENMKIRRYHAAEMNANDGDYKGWHNEGDRKLRFTQKLFEIVSTGKMTAVACGINLADFFSVFPEAERKDLSFPYVLCMKQLMVEIALGMEQPEFENCRVALVHDHGNWDVEALKGYNQMIDDPQWEQRYRFTGITPLTWRDDIGLQAADLIAYELMRWLDDHLWTERDMRPALKALTAMNDHIYGTYFNRESLEFIRTNAEGKD